MKLDCAVVKDLYILYEENELSPEVKEAVEAHLKECEECRKIYKTHSGFPDVMKEKVDVPLKKLDEKLLLKLKISRLKVVIAFILVMAFMGLFSVYYQSRVFLTGDFQRYSQNLYDYKYHIDNLKTHRKEEVNNRNSYNKTAGEMLETLNKASELVKRNLNIIERNNFKAADDNSYFDISVSTLILMLNNRWENGYWSEKDEEVYKRLKSEIDGLSERASNDGNKLNNKFYILDTKQLKESYEKLNTLAKVYTKYNKLPEEVNFLSEEKLKERINYVLGKNYNKIDLTKNSNLTYRFRAEDEKVSSYYGQIDAVAGKITEIQGGLLTEKGDLIEVDKAREKIKEITLKNLGDEFDVDIKYLGINVNFSSNVNAKVYCFEVQPLFKGYKIFSPIDAKINSNNGEIINYDTIGFRAITPIAKPENLKIDIKNSPEEALKMFTTDNKEDFKYESTHFIKSMFSGEYMLVHYYKGKADPNGNPQELYINVSLGKKEWPAYLEGMLTY